MFRFPLAACVLLPTVTWLCFIPSGTCYPQIKEVETYQTSGIIRGLTPGKIEVELPDGSLDAFKIQNAEEDALALGNARYIARLPAEIKVSGRLSHELIEKGMVLRLSGEFNRDGKMKAPVSTLQMVDAHPSEMVIRGADETRADQFSPCQITGRVINRQPQRVLLFVQKSPLSRYERIYVDITEDAVFEVTASNLGRVVPGDTITDMQIVKFSTGDKVIKKINVELTGKRDKATLTFHDQLEQKHSHLSDEPGRPRMVKSDYFIIYTDLSDRSAAILLDKMETMLALICRYYASPRPRDPIECYVVRDLDNWQGQLPELGIAKIMEGAGVTVTARATIRGSGRVIAKSVVYSCDNHGVCQHEGVHAICSHLFGSPGPVWYAEGMAEMGQYWKPEQLEVAIDPVVIDYLTTAPPKKMAEIVAAGQITGDSWKAYAWRWALCHLLACNSNYSAEFKKLGIAMMRDDSGAVTFDSAYGKVRKEISFEYDQFVANFGNGYRVDLCQWDWRTPFEEILASSRRKVEVKAMAGWQASGVQVVQGRSYDYIAQGTWKIHADGLDLSAQGDSLGRGQLVATILYTEQDEFMLSPAIELGEQGSFVAPMSGKLYVRCVDDWRSLGDNQGVITTFFRRSPE